MQNSDRYSSDVAFTPAVKAIQRLKGSRHAYASMERRGAWQTLVSPELQDFVAAQTSVYLATVNADGQPYIQHRGGPAGFLRVLDAHTLAFVDYSGNKQYISTGNLSENPKAHLFLMDYEHRQRVKIWGTAKVVEGDTELMAKLMPMNYSAKAEQAIVFTVVAWDANCPQHIPVRLDAAAVKVVLDRKDQRIQELESQLATLRQAGGRT